MNEDTLITKDHGGIKNQEAGDALFHGYLLP